MSVKSLNGMYLCVVHVSEESGCNFLSFFSRCLLSDSGGRAYAIVAEAETGHSVSCGRRWDQGEHHHVWWRGRRGGGHGRVRYRDPEERPPEHAQGTTPSRQQQYVSVFVHVCGFDAHINIRLISLFESPWFNAATIWSFKSHVISWHLV